MSTALALSPTWTQERIAELRALAGAGLRAAQIAYRLGVTELAVVGRCAREGIELGVAPPPKPRGRQRDVNQIEESDPLFGVAAPTRADAWLPIEQQEPVPLLVLRDHQCPWPIGEGVTGLCCGRVKGADLPYCPEHTALAYEGGRYHRPRALASRFFHSALRSARR